MSKGVVGVVSVGWECKNMVVGESCDYIFATYILQRSKASSSSSSSSHRLPQVKRPFSIFEHSQISSA